MLGQATGTSDHKIHHGPDSGDATTIPHVVYSATLRRTYIQVAQIPGTPEMESRWSPEIVPAGLPEL